MFMSKWTPSARGRLDHIFCLSLLLLTTAARVVTAQQPGSTSSPWTYSRCDTRYGPDYWADITASASTVNAPAPFAACTAGYNGSPARQSPIDLSQVPADGRLQPLFFAKFVSQLTAIHDGRMIRWFAEREGSMFGTLPSSQVPAANAAEVKFTARFLFAEIHSPSEHTFGGAARAVEMHFIHAVSESTDPAALPLSSHVIVAVTFTTAAYATHDTWNVALSAGLAAKSPRNGLATTTVNATVNVDILGFMPASRDYITYSGTWSYPPCSNALWFVMSEPATVSYEQLTMIRAALGVSTTNDVNVCSPTANTRPTRKGDSRRSSTDGQSSSSVSSTTDRTTSVVRFVDVGTIALDTCGASDDLVFGTEADSSSGPTSVAATTGIAALVFSSISILLTAAVLVIDLRAASRAGLVAGRPSTYLAPTGDEVQEQPTATPAEVS